MLKFPQKKRKLKPPVSLKRKADFAKLFKRGVIQSKRFQAWVYKSDKSADVRLSVIVSRKVSNRAVDRNKWKRRIREILRKEQPVFKCGVHLVVKVRAGQARPASTKELKQEIFKLLRSSEVITDC